jgi:hypothetical protein
VKGTKESGAALGKKKAVGELARATPFVFLRMGAGT